MKKIVLASFILVGIGLSAQSESESFQPRWDKSIKVGVGLSSFIVSEEPEPEAVLSYSVGLGLTRHMNELFAFHSDLLFTKQGTSVNLNDDVSAKVTLDYIGLASSLRFIIKNDGFFGLGVQVSYLVNAEYEISIPRDIYPLGVSSSENITISSEPEDDFINNIDIGLVIEGGTIMFDRIEISSRGVIGVRSITVETVETEESQEDAFNWSLQLAVAYLF